MNAVVKGALSNLVSARVAGPLYWVYVGLLTGIFEVGATLVVVRITRLRHASRADALAFGVGFGAAEAIVLGTLGTVPVALMLLVPHILPEAAREVLMRTFGGSVGAAALLFPALERASALVFHVVTCALVVHGFRVGRPSRWFALAFVYKSTVDAVAAWAVLSFGVGSSEAKLAALELGLAALALASGTILRASMKNAPEEGSRALRLVGG